MLRKWKVYCETEKQFIFSNDSTKPRTCPHDSNHTINPIYTTALISCEKSVKTGSVKEIRFSPSSSWVNETLIGQSPIWEKLGGFQISPTETEFTLLSVAISAFTQGDFSVRLYEPSTSHTLAEISSVTSEKKVAGPVLTLVTREFQPFLGDFPPDSQLYVEVHITASDMTIITKTIQEIMVQWK